MSPDGGDAASRSLAKAPSGISGLDEVTEGGLPRGRTTLVCGSTGCGKTLLALEFLVRGAIDYGEPGVFMPFEETARELAENVRSLGFELDKLIEQKKLVVDSVHVERHEIEEAGEYDLEGLFVRLGYAIDTIGAKRVVLDTIESLFGGFSDTAVLRSELRRLFRWLKDKSVTTIVTGERGEGSSLTRQGIEEYVSDCVILLDHRIEKQVSTRRLRVVKYRGSTHGTNEYPFLIDEDGISVLPITSIGLHHEASHQRIPTGVPRLDTMLGGEGYFRGSSVLVSGTAGTGKTSLAAHFVDAACRRGERCLYMAFEESPSQFLRNMLSIGIDLQPWVQNGALRFRAIRATLYGLEMHLASIYKLVRQFQPQVVVLDPIGSFLQAGTQQDARAMVTRLIDFLKSQQITALMTNLTASGSALEKTAADISSLVDTWILLRDIEFGGERTRAMYILKSRGMEHSNQLREFLLTGHGVELKDVYLGPGGVLTGSARLSQEARERAEAVARREEIGRKSRERARKREALEARIIAMRKEFESEEEEAELVAEQERRTEAVLAQGHEEMARSRQADADSEYKIAPAGA